MYNPTRKRLGEILVEAGVIKVEQLNQALLKQAETGERLGKILVQSGFISDSDIFRVLENQLGIQYINLSKTFLDSAIVRLIPENIAKRYRVVAIKKQASRLVVAMVDPLNIYALDDIRISSGFDVEPVMALESDILQAIEQHYGLKDSLDKIIEDLPEKSSMVNEEELGLDQLKQLVEEAPVVKLVNSLLQQAVLDRATDIHVDPQEKFLRIRYRVDGMLLEVMESPKKMQAAIISRLKIMANLDIAERRVPQDGRIQLNINNREIDLRVSTMPTIFGEKVVLRILDKSKGFLQLDYLGMTESNLEKCKRVIGKPHGMVLVTGPTGSGKTTTLYGMLGVVNSKDKNIITLEDPVEYTMLGINQVQINPKSGVQFSTGLRAVLRQDPDIIMVGEIRDSDTARIAVQAAMTGHLVLSTLHTNSAASTLARLLDMDIEPFLLASSVQGIVAQRLVRALCPECKQSYKPSEVLIKELELVSYTQKEEVTLYKPTGCGLCNNSGYLGRLALHEMLLISDSIRNLISQKVSSVALESQAIAEGMITLKQDGLGKALAGITSLEEVIRTVYIDSSSLGD